MKDQPTHYQIAGYDRLMGESYLEPEKYETFDEAQKRCRSMEYVIPVYDSKHSIELVRT